VKCPKCNNSGERFDLNQVGMYSGRQSKEHHIRYCTGAGERPPVSMLERPVREGCVVAGAPASEHLDTECGVCAFRFVQPCADAKP
jgi:hypothetical protein